MPIVAHNALPTFDYLRAQGQQILDPDRALHQDIRELHIGLLNMMPDAALTATERQFFRLVGQSNPIAQFYVHPFTLDALARSDEARDHVARYYEPFERIRAEGLDGLIITGANVTGPDLSQEPFWEPLSEVMTWAWENVRLHALLLPGHPCGAPAELRQAASALGGEALGGLPSSGRGSHPPPGE